MKESDQRKENNLEEKKDHIKEEKNNEKKNEIKDDKVEEKKVDKIEEKKVDKNEQKKDDKKEEKKEIKIYRNICQLCSKKFAKNPNIKCVCFNNCDHEICYICLYKILIRSYIKPISQIHSTKNIMKINCVCEIGSIELSIQEIISILTSLNKNINDIKVEPIEDYTPNEKKCQMHNVPITEFCLECFEPICSECIDEKTKKRKMSIHCNHKTTSYNDFFIRLCKNIEEAPNLKIILGDKNKFEENFYEKYSDLINIKFESLVNEINYIKEKIINNIKKEYEKYKPSMEAMNLLFNYYNFELASINKDTDINQLMFLYNTNIFLPELNYQFEKAESILNEAIKKLNDTKLENMFEFKFKSINVKPYECIQTIHDTHNTNITSVSTLYNNKFVSGDFDGNVKIWKHVSNRYILFQEIKGGFNGAINNICKIKLNKFAVCSQSSPQINIFQEDINSEKYILIQEIKLNETILDQNKTESSESLKYFNRINTLNDENSLIATTKDNYIYIYQDKIGGIPKQNYMKANYELVEFFEAYHTNNINLIIHTKTENIITASEDSTIKVWNKDRKYSTLIGHEDSVNALVEIERKYITSGGSDSIIILWELNDNDDKYTLRQKLLGHQFSVIGLEYLNNDRLISASIDDTIKIWQRNKYELFINKITIKEDKLGIVGIVNIDNDSLITYSNDRTLKIWAITKKTNININNKLEEKKLNNGNEDIKKNRTESVDYMVKNSIQKLANDEKINKEKGKEKKKKKKNEIEEINTNSNQNKI